MRLLRGLAGLLLWIVAAVLGLLGVILCATLILLPLGLPVLGYARNLFGLSMRLMLPRAVAHPVEATREATRRGRRGKTSRESDARSSGARSRS